MERLKPVPVEGKDWHRLIVEHVGTDGETYAFETTVSGDLQREFVESMYCSLEAALEGQLKEMGLW